MNTKAELQPSTEPPLTTEAIDEPSEPQPLPTCGEAGRQSKTRIGKIARLPRQIREELNHRLADGEVGKDLIAWLNQLPEVQAVLAAQFGGRPIKAQNLSDWKQGGFEEWQRHQEARAWMQTLIEEDDELKAEMGAVPLAERLTTTMLVALGRLLHEASASAPGPEQRKTVLSVAAQLARLRQGDLAAERVRMERERWAAQQEEVREAKQKEAEEDAAFQQATGPLFARWNESNAPRKNVLTPGLLEVIEANNRLRIAHEKAQAEANQGKSNQIKANQGESR